MLSLDEGSIEKIAVGMIKPAQFRFTLRSE